MFGLIRTKIFIQPIQQGGVGTGKNQPGTTLPFNHRSKNLTGSLLQSIAPQNGYNPMPFKLVHLAQRSSSHSSILHLPPADLTRQTED